jgi:cytoskeletal protein CcmA (bactofilin family)
MPKIEDIEKIEPEIEAFPENIAGLGPTFVCSGELTAEEDFLVKGTFKGTIRLKNHSLYIDKDAHVEASIEARNVSLYGQLTGSICASNRVFLSSEAQMSGDITASKISIQDGAHFKGAIKMEKGRASKPDPH